jgi:multiple sugar transport system permease protein
VTRAVGPAMRHALLLATVVVTLFPIAFIVQTSFKYLRDITAGGFAFTPTLSNYLTLFTGSRGTFGRLALNSLSAGVLSTVVVLAVGALAAYSLSRFRWPVFWSGLILGWLLFVHMLPPITFVGPFYLLARGIGIYDSPLAVAMAHVVLNLPFAIWMLQSFFADIPSELEEAAAIDGCNRMTTFLRIILPLARPGLFATAILTFIFSWKDFLFALTLTSTPAGMTIPVGIATFAQEYSVRYGEMAAAASLAIVPALVFVVFAQRHIVKGLTFGALKG